MYKFNWKNATPETDITQSAREKTYHSVDFVGTTEPLVVGLQTNCHGWRPFSFLMPYVCRVGVLSGWYRVNWTGHKATEALCGIIVLSKGIYLYCALTKPSLF